MATIILPISATFDTIFVKASKTLIFLVKSCLGNFYRHLATSFWSHWLCGRNVIVPNDDEFQVINFEIVHLLFSNLELRSPINQKMEMPEVTGFESDPPTSATF